jgi:hypothetical protein
MPPAELHRDAVTVTVTRGEHRRAAGRGDTRSMSGDRDRAGHTGDQGEQTGQQAALGRDTIR